MENRNPTQSIAISRFNDEYSSIWARSLRPWKASKAFPRLRSSSSSAHKTRMPLVEISNVNHVNVESRYKLEVKEAKQKWSHCQTRKLNSVQIFEPKSKYRQREGVRLILLNCFVFLQPLLKCFQVVHILPNWQTEVILFHQSLPFLFLAPTT